MHLCQSCGAQIYKSSQRCRTCANRARMVSNPSKATARSRTARAVRMESCQSCGSTTELSRHHPDIRNNPDMAIVLCWRCHAREDQRLGKWGTAAKHMPITRPMPTLENRTGVPIVHLVGPPASGKTTVCRSVPQIRSVAVDDYRDRYGDEYPDRVASDIVESTEPLIVESSGINGRVNHAVYTACRSGKRRGLIVVMRCDEIDMVQRMLSRGTHSYGTLGDFVYWGRRLLLDMSELYPSGVALWYDDVRRAARMIKAFCHGR